MSKLISSCVHIAKKPYVCDSANRIYSDIGKNSRDADGLLLCAGWINPGEYYQRDKLVDYEFYEWKSHGYCLKTYFQCGYGEES